MFRTAKYILRLGHFSSKSLNQWKIELIMLRHTLKVINGRSIKSANSFYKSIGSVRIFVWMGKSKCKSVKDSTSIIVEVNEKIK